MGTGMRSNRRSRGDGIKTQSKASTAVGADFLSGQTRHGGPRASMKIPSLLNPEGKAPSPCTVVKAAREHGPQVRKLSTKKGQDFEHSRTRGVNPNSSENSAVQNNTFPESSR